MKGLPPEVESTLFRIVQESVSNILRHSGANTANVRLERDSRSVRIEIADNGHSRGKEALSSLERGAALGVGVAGMRERVRQFGGKFEVRSGSTGTTALVSVPLLETCEEINDLQPQSHGDRVRAERRN